MAESLYYLYTATNDPIWLDYGAEIIKSLSITRVVPYPTTIPAGWLTDQLTHLLSLSLSLSLCFAYPAMRLHGS